MATRKRRSNGEGTIFFDKSRGRWIALISLPNGQRKKASALTQKEARLKLVEMLADLENHGAVFDQTETGKVMMAARQAMQDQDAPQPMWFYLTPGDR